MKKIVCASLVLCLVLSICLPKISVYASESNTTNVLKQNIEDAFAYKLKECNAVDVQELISTAWVEKPENGVVETYLMAIRGYYKGLDYSEYAKQLTDSIGNEDVWAKMQGQIRCKHGLVYTALGQKNAYTEYARKQVLKDDSIMSVIYGLLLLHANGENDSTAVDNLADKLLDKQLSDGGFAYTGNEGDVDVTAYACQSLAPCVKKNEKIKEAVNKALTFLSDVQLENGDFGSMGNASSESTAQVILALHALQIDYKTDQRFIKNEHTVLDGLLQYKVSDGGFAHIAGGQSNDMATAQGLSALVSLYRMETNQSFLYDYSNESYDVNAVSPDGERGFTLSYKWIAAGVVCLLAVGYLLIWGRKSKKRAIGALGLSAVIILGIFTINIQSADEYYQVSHKDDIKHPVNVTLEIRCDTVAGKADYIPKDGVILKKEETTVEEGSTVFDVLTKVTAERKIQMEYKDAAYIEGIQYLYERDYGELSGWMYQVNQVFPNVGCGDYKVQEGDTIRWLYTCNLGKDVGDQYDE